MDIEFLADNASWTLTKNGTCLCIPAIHPAQYLGELEQGKEYICTIKKKTAKRSLDANAYYWVLCGKLAQALHISPDEIYLRHVKDVGNYETLCVQNKALESFKCVWCSGHTGRFVETKESKLPGCTTILCYYGSSDFDVAQMTQLIDNCIQDCNAVGIETRPQEEIESLLSQWEEHEKADAAYEHFPGR